MTDSYDRRFPKVTDRALDDLRKRINVKIENTHKHNIHIIAIIITLFSNI